MEDANQARNLSDASEHSEWVSPELQPPAYPQGGPPEFYSIDWNNAAKIALTTGLKFVPYVGSILGGLVSILWPSSKEDVWEDIREKVEKLIDEKIAQRTYNEIKNALKGLHNNIDEYQNALQYSQGNPDVISENWTTAHNLFVNDLPDFQDESYELLLLPLFAQFANLHLSLLRDGAIFGSQWGWTESYVTSIEKKLTGTIKAYQDYANRVYTEGRRNVVAQAETNPRYCEPFRTENKYVREMTETVLDYLEIWGYMDSTAYPVPVMFDFFRELYSDPCGSCDDSGSIPLLYSTPPEAGMETITVWGWDRIDAIQVDYPYGQGPNGWTSTGRMGNSDGGSSAPPTGGVFDVRIKTLKAVWVGYGDIVNSLWFDFGNGYGSMMGGWAGKGDQHYEFRAPKDNYISRIHINGVSYFYGSADCIVIGYQYDPSDESIQQAIRRLYVHTPGERSFPDMAAQYATQLKITPENLIALAAEEGWEQERQQHWQTLREQVQRRKAEGSESGQGPSTSTETR